MTTDLIFDLNEVVFEKDEDEHKEKWIVVDKHDEILKEMEMLKSMMVDLHQIIHLQSEGVNKITDTIETINDRVQKVDNELHSIKDSQVNSTRFGYIRDYVFPIVGAASLNYPIFWVFGPKTGMIASTLSYLMWKTI